MTNADIVKGSKLMVFLADKVIGFGTSDSLNLTTNTTEVSTKSHGTFPSVVPQNVTWEVSSENLYSDEGEATYMDLMLKMTPVHIKFAKASNYNNDYEPGIVGTTESKTWTVGDVITEGDAIITSFSINAPSGDNATMSVTFTGIGALAHVQTPG